MTKKVFTFSLLAFLTGVGTIFVLLVLGAFSFRMDFVPDSSYLLSHPAIQPFLVDATELEGVYGNRDVDSMVFAYKTLAGDEITFWRIIETRAVGDSWKQVEVASHRRAYERLSKRKGNRGTSAEGVEVRYQHPSNEVRVSWVQADTTSGADSFSTTDEARWAQQVIAPKMNSSR